MRFYETVIVFLVASNGVNIYGRDTSKAFLFTKISKYFPIDFSALECFACDNGAFGERCINQPASIENGFIKCQDDKTHCYTSKLEDKPDGSKATSNKSQAYRYRQTFRSLSPQISLCFENSHFLISYHFLDYFMV